MASLIYLKNPQDCTTTRGGITFTWEILDYWKSIEYNPWIGEFNGADLPT